MAWRGRCNRNKYWGLPTPALRINSIERYRKAWWVFQDLARTAWLHQWFFPVCSGKVKDGSTYMVFISIKYIFQTKVAGIHQQLQLHRPDEYMLIPCYTCEDNQIQMIACRERRPLQYFHHIFLGIPTTRDDIRIRLALGQGFGLVLNEPILQEQALTGSRTTASTRGWKLEMCWSMPGFRFLAWLLKPKTS